MIRTHYGDRRTGKTTRLCQDIAQYQRDYPNRRVFLVGPHVIRNLSMYKRMLHEAGADQRRVIFASKDIEHHTRGAVGDLFVDDLGDFPSSVRVAVRRAAKMMR